MPTCPFYNHFMIEAIMTIMNFCKKIYFNYNLINRCLNVERSNDILKIFNGTV